MEYLYFLTSRVWERVVPRLLICIYMCQIVFMLFGLLMPPHPAGFDIAIANIALIFERGFEYAICFMHWNACRMSSLVSEQTGYLWAIGKIIILDVSHGKEHFI